MKLNIRIGFIGFGRMGSALAQGAMNAQALTPARIIAYDTDPGVRKKMKRRKIRPAGSLMDVVEVADVVFLCVKPQQMNDVLKELSSTPLKALLGKKCVVSIAAGVPLARLERSLGEHVPLIRVMPNTPALLGAGMSVMSVGRRASRRHVLWVKQILSSVGDVVVEAEHIMDAVTAVSGSGPAYVFYLAESLIEAAEGLGLSEALSSRLVRQTICGAGRMLGSREESAAELRRQVTSPGGTTAAAISEFDLRDMKGIIRDAVRKAADRSTELASD